MKDTEKAYYQQQGAVLRTMREAVGKTRYDVAEYFGVKYDYISKIERGESPLSSFDLTAWGECLGCVFILEGNTVKAYQKAGG